MIWPQVMVNSGEGDLPDSLAVCRYLTFLCSYAVDTY